VQWKWAAFRCWLLLSYLVEEIDAFTFAKAHSSRRYSAVAFGSSKSCTTTTTTTRLASTNNNNKATTTTTTTQQEEKMLSSVPDASMTGIKDLIEIHGYTTLLLDMWGVMHDGSNPYEGVIETVEQLKEAGIKLIILSNSSKRKENSVKMLTKLGFNPADFEQIITSGEVSWQMLDGSHHHHQSMNEQEWSDIFQKTPSNEKKVFVFGSGAQDEEYCSSCGWSLAPMEEASLIVARGTFTICDGETVVSKKEDEEVYDQVMMESLRKAARRKVPMLVTNPDKVRPDKGLPPMPGAIADLYQKELGEENLIKRIGKPFPEVYKLALEGVEEDLSKVCMVGDALETDITGGRNVGCGTLWIVKDGIHGPKVAESANFEEGLASVLKTFNGEKGLTGDDQVIPMHVLPHFRW